jgi:hypothetical protein
MNIDERLEKLVERHEALAQTVGLIAMQTQQNAVEIQSLTPLIRDMSAGISGLTAIARSHERRLANLEGTS